MRQNTINEVHIFEFLQIIDITHSTSHVITTHWCQTYMFMSIFWLKESKQNLKHKSMFN